MHRTQIKSQVLANVGPLRSIVDKEINDRLFFTCRGTQKLFFIP